MYSRRFNGTSSSPGEPNRRMPGIFTLWILAALIFTFLYSKVQSTDAGCAVTAHTARPLLASTLNIKPLWTVQIGIDWGSSNRQIVSTPDLLIVANTCYRVTALSWKMGRVTWNSEEVPHFALTIDQQRNRIYVEASGEIRALSISDGKTLWINKSQRFDHTSHSVQLLATGQVLTYVDGVWNIDPANGVLGPSSLRLPPYTQLYCDGVAYTIEVRRIRAIAVPTGKPLWVTPTDERGSMIGYVDDCTEDNPLIVKWGAWLTAVDRQSGRILWDLEDRLIISNVVVDNGLIYVLDADANLIVLNAKDGSLRGKVQFEPPKKSELLYEPGAIGGSSLAVNNSLIAIYFQDTHILSVLDTGKSLNSGR
jgi:outer membrane protein assembly factor BamB